MAVSRIKVVTINTKSVSRFLLPDYKMSGRKQLPITSLTTTIQPPQKIVRTHLIPPSLRA